MATSVDGVIGPIGRRDVRTFIKRPGGGFCYEKVFVKFLRQNEALSADVVTRDRHDRMFTFARDPRRVQFRKNVTKILVILIVIYNLSLTSR